jgi:hypothetical protein
MAELEERRRVWSEGNVNTRRQQREFDKESHTLGTEGKFKLLLSYYIPIREVDMYTFPISQIRVIDICKHRQSKRPSGIGF